MVRPRYGTIHLLLLPILLVVGSVGARETTSGFEAVHGMRFSRLIGAKDVDIKNAPYTIQLRVNGTLYCGGTLIAPRYVVTAAHCLQTYPPNKFLVVGNASTISEEGVQRKALQFFIHPEYSVKAKEDRDVAVIKLDNDMTGENVEIISLYDKSLEAGDVLQVYGWGLTNSSVVKLSEHLQTSRIPVISQNDCEDIFQGTQSKITDAMVCAFKPGELDTCTGDSGGPAVVNGQLAAVISWGLTCGSDTYPGIYTRIDVVRDFIEESLKQ